MMIKKSEGSKGLDTSVIHVFHAEARESIKLALSMIRRHLDMDVAFISEFIGDWRYMHYVDTQNISGAPISAGDRISLQDGYCRSIVEGQLPELIFDTAENPEAAAIPATEAFPIGAHISVPLHLADGTVFGTFCCFNFTARPDLGQHDLDAVRKVADEVAKQIDDSNYKLPIAKLESFLKRNPDS